jgi:hypothetical protein
MGFPRVPVPDENAFPYGRFRSINIKNDYAAERHVTDRREDQVNLYIRLCEVMSNFLMLLVIF